MAGATAKLEIKLATIYPDTFRRGMSRCPERAKRVEGFIRRRFSSVLPNPLLFRQRRPDCVKTLLNKSRCHESLKQNPLAAGKTRSKFFATVNEAGKYYFLHKLRHFVTIWVLICARARRHSPLNLKRLGSGSPSSSQGPSAQSASVGFRPSLHVPLPS